MRLTRSASATLPANTTLEQLMTTLKGVPPTAKVAFREHKGDRPFDPGYVTVTATWDEEA